MKTFLANDELGTTSEESVGFIFWGRSESGSQDGVDHVLHGIGFSSVASASTLPSSKTVSGILRRKYEP